MCGVVGWIGGDGPNQVHAALDLIAHRGPDAVGRWDHAHGGLGHRRLSILDLSDAGRQPMTSADGRHTIAFNGEIYNYRELRGQLSDHCFVTGTDTEVLLAAWEAWGPGCLDRLVGMFAFLVWDEAERRLYAVRDRFGVKPLYYATLPDRAIGLASEIKALHAMGLPRQPDTAAWASYFATGAHDHTERTFWQGVSAVPPGHLMVVDTDGRRERRCWYDLAERVSSEFDGRAEDDVLDEYGELLLDSVRLRFRADVPVGINLSGGLDSSALLAAVHGVQGPESDVMAFTFATGDDRYDELPWVAEMLAATRHPSVVCTLTAADVPGLAESVYWHQDEPYGGIPTLAYARLFDAAKERGVTVLLDGQGMDEQWAGYDYYQDPTGTALVQGTTTSPVRPECLEPGFRDLTEPFEAPTPFPDRLRNLQYRDLRRTKLQRALRFNDRVSMRASRELREPFLDHRLVELALRQPPERKIGGGTGKLGLRRLLSTRLPGRVVEAPKRPLQTPQREWLREDLAGWATDCIEDGLGTFEGWLDAPRVRAEWAAYRVGADDSAYHIWQWVSLGLAARHMAG